MIIGSIVLSGAVSAASLAASPQPKIHHDNNNTGQSQYKGPATNSTKWKYTTGDGIQSSPTIGNDGTIYIGCEDHKLYALNPNGTLKWNYTAGGIIDSCATIGGDGTIYFGCSDSKLYALNPNGTQKWNYTTGNAILSSPTIGKDGTIYIGSFDKKLYAINPDGTLKWNYTTGNIITCTPAIGSDGTIYLGSTDKKLYALNPDGTQKWNYTAGSYILFSPAIGSDGTIYFGSDDHKLYALNPDGTQKWNYTAGNYINSAPAIGTDGTIYVGTYDSFIYALNPDGTQKWNYTIEGIILSDITIGSDETIYFGSNDTRLYALNQNGTLKWNYTTGSFIDSNPAIGSDGTIYFGSADDNLYAVYDVPVKANFTGNTTSGAAPLKVHFTDNSTGDITSYAWDFNNDGVIDSTEQNPTYTYNTPGTYTVTETVTGPAGTNNTTFTGYINVNYPAPVANFTADTTTGTSPETVHFTDKSTGKVTSYAWDFNNDGVIDSTGQNPTWTYTAPGTYTVTETVTGPGGSSTETFTNYVTINWPAPVANFTVNSTTGIAPEIVQFTDKSTGNISNYAWDFNNDGVIDSTLQNPIWTYSTAGTYTVKETVAGPGGSSTETFTDYITINPDKTSPSVTSNVPNGLYNTKTVTLTATDNKDSNPKIYYTLNGSVPTISSTLYTGPILISKEGTNILRFIAVDMAGNISNLESNIYTIDTTSPTAAANVKTGIYNTDKVVKLTMNKQGTIYYTLNGKTPTTSSTKYTGPLNIKSTSTIKFFAVDIAGNKSPLYTNTYTIDKVAPKPVKTTPIQNAKNVSLTAPIIIKFNENISEGVKFSKIYIKNLSTGKIVKSTVNIINRNTITIKMTKSRLSLNNYEIVIPTSAAKDAAGNNNSKYVLNFKTRKY